VLNANRNDWRKRPELTLRAFAAVVERHPDARLVLHCNPRRRDVDLRVESKRLRLGDHVILTHDRDDQPWPERRLSQLYACCDVGVNSALAEAWGMVAFEHALHGAAQVLPAHPALREIWGDAPAWAPVGETVRVDNVFEGAAPVVERLSSILLDLVGQPERARAVGDACARRAGNPMFSWRHVGDAWCRLVARILDGGRVPEVPGVTAMTRGGVLSAP
jgi:glycosyltransferase involved in cell wall biosynthesis